MAVYPQGSPNPQGSNQQMSVAQQIKQQMAWAKQQQMAQSYASMLGAQAKAQGTSQTVPSEVRVQVNKMTGPARRLIKLILAILGTVSLHAWLVWGHPDTNTGDTAVGWLVSIFIAGIMWVLLHGAANYVLRGDPTSNKDD